MAATDIPSPSSPRPIAESRPGVSEPLRLLEAIMRFTAERNREALDAVLLETMMEVLPVAGAELYRRDPGDGSIHNVFEFPPEAGLAPGPDEVGLHEKMEGDLRDCLQRMARLKPGDENFRAVYASDYSLHPLFDAEGLNGIIALANLPGQSADPALVHGLLRVYRNFVAVIDDAHRDTLTGLLNRKTFETSIQSVLRETQSANPGESAECQQERRKSKPGAEHWLAVMDIDHFKRINDTFGHLYGDEVLLLLARLMQQSFRRSDRLYRFGGEEFAVLLGPCTPADARMVLDRFRTTVEHYLFPQVGQVTISIGFVAIGDQDVPATVVGHADEALYASKHGGRNRVTCFADLKVATAPAPEPQGGSFDLF
jgi:diguanylate cyclase (GGDEF)-like protein